MTIKGGPLRVNPQLPRFSEPPAPDPRTWFLSKRQPAIGESKPHHPVGPGTSLQEKVRRDCSQKRGQPDESLSPLIAGAPGFAALPGMPEWAFLPHFLQPEQQIGFDEVLGNRRVGVLNHQIIQSSILLIAIGDKTRDVHPNRERERPFQQVVVAYPAESRCRNGVDPVFSR